MNKKINKLGYMEKVRIYEKNKTKNLAPILAGRTSSGNPLYFIYLSVPICKDNT
jgi:hypothetical protein